MTTDLAMLCAAGLLAILSWLLMALCGTLMGDKP